MLRRGAIGAGALAALAGSQKLVLSSQPALGWFCQPRPRQRRDADLSGKAALVVGAGVAGISVAHALARRGYTVTILDGRDGPAAPGASSAAAAGGMEYTHHFTAPHEWVTMMRQLLPRLPGDDSYRFFYLDWSTVPDFGYLRWLGWFAWESLIPNKSRDEAREQFAHVVEWSINQTIGVIEELRLPCHYATPGSIRFQATAGGGGYSLGMQPGAKMLSRAEAVAVDPAIQAVKPDVDEFVFTPGGGRGDAELYTQALAKHCFAKEGVRLLTGANVVGFDKEDGRVTGVWTETGVIEVPADVPVVLCAGAWSMLVCDALGVFCPVYPLKGYDALVRAPVTKPGCVLSSGYLYACPLGDKIRVASMAQFCGWDVSVHKPVAEALQREATRIFPGWAEEIKGAHIVAGLRPYAADERPLLGRIPGFANAYINAGPGHTGWKAAAGFAELVVRDVCGEPAPIDASSTRPEGRMPRALNPTTAVLRAVQ